MDDITREPTAIRAEDINPRYHWGRALPALQRQLLEKQLTKTMELS